MRIALSAAAALVMAIPALAAEDVATQENTETEAETSAEPRRCTPAQVVVPPFNNTAEAMEQSRFAATVLHGDQICKTSAVFPEKSLIEHGEEEPVLPKDAIAETVEEQPPVEPA